MVRCCALHCAVDRRIGNHNHATTAATVNGTATTVNGIATTAVTVNMLSAFWATKCVAAAAGVAVIVGAVCVAVRHGTVL